MFDGKVGSSRKVDFGGKRVRTDQKSVLEIARKEREQRAQDRVKAQASTRVQKSFRGYMTRKAIQASEREVVLKKIEEIHKIKHVLQTTRGVVFVVPKETLFPLSSSLLASFKQGDEEILAFVLELMLEGLVDGGSLLSDQSCPPDLACIPDPKYLYSSGVYKLSRLLRHTLSVIPTLLFSPSSASLAHRLVQATSSIWPIVSASPFAVVIFAHLAESCAWTLCRVYPTLEPVSDESSPSKLLCTSLSAYMRETYAYMHTHHVSLYSGTFKTLEESLHGVTRALLSFPVVSFSSRTPSYTPSALLSQLFSDFSTNIRISCILPPISPQQVQAHKHTVQVRSVYAGGRMAAQQPTSTSSIHMLSVLLHTYRSALPERLTLQAQKDLSFSMDVDEKSSVDDKTVRMDDGMNKSSSDGRNVDSIPALLVDAVEYLSSYLTHTSIPSLLTVLQGRGELLRSSSGRSGMDDVLHPSSLDLSTIQEEYVYLSSNRRLDMHVSIVQEGVRKEADASEEEWGGILDFFLDVSMMEKLFTPLSRTCYYLHENSQQLNLPTVHFLSHLLHIYHTLHMCCPIHIRTHGGGQLTPMHSELGKVLCHNLLQVMSSSLLFRLFGFLQNVFAWGVGDVAEDGSDNTGVLGAWTYPPPVAQGGVSIFHLQHPYYSSLSQHLQILPAVAYAYFNAAVSVFQVLLLYTLRTLDDEDFFSTAADGKTGIRELLMSGSMALVCRLLRDRLWGGLVGATGTSIAVVGVGEDANPLAALDFTSILPTIHLAFPWLTTPSTDMHMSIAAVASGTIAASSSSKTSCVQLLSPLCVYATGIQLLNELIIRGERRNLHITIANTYTLPLFEWERDIHLPIVPSLALKDVAGGTAGAEGEQMFPSLKSYVARCVLTLCHMAIPFPPRLFLFRSLLEREKSLVALSIFGGPMVKIRVHRGDRLLADAFRQVMTGDGRGDLKGKLSVEFVSELNVLEAGIDGGGLFKEFLNSFSQALLGGQADTSGTNARDGRSTSSAPASAPLFREVEDRKLVPLPLVRGNDAAGSATSSSMLYSFPAAAAAAAGGSHSTHANEAGEDVSRGAFDAPILDVYKFVGKMVGKALYEGILLNCEFSPLLLNLLLGRTNTFDDLQHYDRDIYQSMLKLKKMGREGSERDIEALGLHFEINLKNAQGQIITVPLLPGTASHGSPQPVTLSNLPLYLSLVPHALLNQPLYHAVRCMGVGMGELLPSPWLRLFSPRELGLLVSGIGGGGGLDIADMKKHVVYAGGYGGGEDVVQWFWEVLAEMPWEEQELLLKFVTSVPRAPLLGFGSLNPPLCIQKVPLFEQQHATAPRLPMASTCVHMLRLPPYPTKHLLREKLLLAIHSNSGFELT